MISFLVKKGNRRKGLAAAATQWIYYEGDRLQK